MSLIGATTIAWDDSHKRGNVMWKVPRNIRLNDNIVVREDEYAVFYRDGKALAYIDRPDRYALTSINAPVVGTIVRLLSGVQQWAEVYYIQKKPFDAKFGSKQPYAFRDREFGLVNLRVFGEFRYRVNNPKNFINQFVGTMNLHTSREIEERTKDQMVILVYDALGKMKERGMGVVDLASNLTTIEQVVLEKSKDHFDMYGVLVEKISGLYISMPEEVQKAVDARSSMQILGTNYMQYQAGQAMRDAATNPGGGGMAGAGVGLGAGVGMGYVMLDAMRQQAQPPPTATSGTMPGGATGAVPPAQTKQCIKCGAQIPVNVKFCPNCGASQDAGETCPKCNKPLTPGAKFCPNCGAKLESTCPKCNKPVTPGAKFCPNCGAKLE